MTKQPDPLREAIDKAIAIGCIRKFWGAARPCDECTDSREPCGICALRTALHVTDPLREAVEEILSDPLIYHDVGKIHKRLRAAIKNSEES